MKVLAPSYTPAPKVAQIRAFGAEVQLVPGPREESEHEAVRQSASIFYASHNWHPFFLQGTKTLAYELWEDLGFVAPDNVVIPAGAGSNVLGCWIGFKELLAAGQIAKLPRIFVAQPLNCSPVDASFVAGVDTLVDRIVKPTIAEGTAIKRPVRLQEILQALRETINAWADRVAHGMDEPTFVAAARADVLASDPDEVDAYDRAAPYWHCFMSASATSFARALLPSCALPAASAAADSWSAAATS